MSSSSLDIPLPKMGGDETADILFLEAQLRIKASVQKLKQGGGEHETFEPNLTVSEEDLFPGCEPLPQPDDDQPDTNFRLNVEELLQIIRSGATEEQKRQILARAVQWQRRAQAAREAREAQTRDEIREAKIKIEEDTKCEALGIVPEAISKYPQAKRVKTYHEVSGSEQAVFDPRLKTAIKIETSPEAIAIKKLENMD